MFLVITLLILINIQLYKISKLFIAIDEQTRDIRRHFDDEPLDLSDFEKQIDAHIKAQKKTDVNNG